MKEVRAEKFSNTIRVIVCDFMEKNVPYLHLSILQAKKHQKNFRKFFYRKFFYVLTLKFRLSYQPSLILISEVTSIALRYSAPTPQ